MRRLAFPSSSPIAGLVLFRPGRLTSTKRCVARFCWSAPHGKHLPPAARPNRGHWADTWPVAALKVKRIHASTIVLARQQR